MYQFLKHSVVRVHFIDQEGATTVDMPKFRYFLAQHNLKGLFIFPLPTFSNEQNNVRVHLPSNYFTTLERNQTNETAFMTKLVEIFFQYFRPR